MLHRNKSDSLVPKPAGLFLFKKGKTKVNEKFTLKPRRSGAAQSVGFPARVCIFSPRTLDRADPPSYWKTGWSGSFDGRLPSDYTSQLRCYPTAITSLGVLECWSPGSVASLLLPIHRRTRSKTINVLQSRCKQAILRLYIGLS